MKVIVSGVLIAGSASGELIVYENTNPALDTLEYYQLGEDLMVFGQSLNVTRGAFDQVSDEDTPVGSVLITWFESHDGIAGDWINLGTGRNTRVATAGERVDVIDPYTGFAVPHPGPADFDDGGLIGEDSDWSQSWLAMHTVSGTTPDQGVFFTDDSFTLGLQFLMDEQIHYGFLEMTRTGFEPGSALSIGYRPVRWGYETTAGASVPGVGSLGVLTGALCLGGARRRRRLGL